MSPATALVITSISAPDSVSTARAQGRRESGVDFLVAGHVSSPPQFALDGCYYWGIDRQRALPLRLAQRLPERHYARKNLGYLVAMQRGAQVITETLPERWREDISAVTAHRPDAAEFAFDAAGCL